MLTPDLVQTLTRQSGKPYYGVSRSWSRLGVENDGDRRDCHLSGSWRASPARVAEVRDKQSATFTR